MITLALISVVVTVLMVMWHFSGPEETPDDPWMMDNGHTLSHYYNKGMGDPYDQKLQENSNIKMDERDLALSRIRARHTDNRFPSSLKIIVR
jgi:hypothetical protein